MDVAGGNVVAGLRPVQSMEEVVDTGMTTDKEKDGCACGYTARLRGKYGDGTSGLLWCATTAYVAHDYMTLALANFQAVNRPFSGHS